MIKFIEGNTGGGKSLYAATLIVEELERGEKAIVTNLALNIPRLNEYMQERTGRDCRVVQRVRLITPDECKTFWAYRGPASGGGWLTLELPGRMTQETDLRPIYANIEAAKAASGITPHERQAACEGVLYVVDEVHTIFNARRWQETGPGALWYLSQHRKLNDEVILISQKRAQVDKQLRMLTGEYVRVINLRTRKFLQVFRCPRRFWRHHFYEEPAKGDKPDVVGSFALDTHGVASVYDTAAGNGVQGTGADKGAVVRGIPWYVIFAAPLLVVGVIWGLDRAAGWGIRRIGNFGDAGQPAIPSGLSNMSSNGIQQAQPRNGTPVGPAAGPAPSPGVAPAIPPPPWEAPQRPPRGLGEALGTPSPVVGWIAIGSKVTAYREDGTVITPQTGLQEVARGYVVVNGAKITIKHTAPPQFTFKPEP